MTQGWLKCVDWLAAVNKHETQLFFSFLKWITARPPHTHTHSPAPKAPAAVHRAIVWLTSPTSAMSRETERRRIEREREREREREWLLWWRDVCLPRSVPSSPGSHGNPHNSCTSWGRRAALHTLCLWGFLLVAGRGGDGGGGGGIGTVIPCRGRGNKSSGYPLYFDLLPKHPHLPHALYAHFPFACHLLIILSLLFRSSICGNNHLSLWRAEEYIWWGVL